mmetsp:Transcript_12728/g.43070  ORF Transcript_12728/g.43070 Transcript_12728/m.43070 type:complete len:344 (+) Transcript_12728:253-1284(+)
MYNLVHDERTWPSAPSASLEVVEQHAAGHAGRPPNAAVRGEHVVHDHHVPGLEGRGHRVAPHGGPDGRQLLGAHLVPVPVEGVVGRPVARVHVGREVKVVPVVCVDAVEPHRLLGDGVREDSVAVVLVLEHVLAVLAPVETHLGLLGELGLHHLLVLGEVLALPGEGVLHVLLGPELLAVEHAVLARKLVNQARRLHVLGDLAHVREHRLAARALRGPLEHEEGNAGRVGGVMGHVEVGLDGVLGGLVGGRAHVLGELRADGAAPAEGARLPPEALAELGKVLGSFHGQAPEEEGAVVEEGLLLGHEGVGRGGVLGDGGAGSRGLHDQREGAPFGRENLRGQL